jgi:hypothetical protein
MIFKDLIKIEETHRENEIFNFTSSVSACHTIILNPLHRVLRLTEYRDQLEEEIKGRFLWELYAEPIRPVINDLTHVIRSLYGDHDFPPCEGTALMLNSCIDRLRSICGGYHRVIKDN